ncbi:MAG: uroporphyrinogen-III C-methyltransferase [Sphingomonadales bacterium]|nr:uroporphyrinogen-III C-methyltransferase [Sphingomonadales bacterium]MDE2569309.1 uroporphyrinogen-III C-methyltransferase [Sphingomonadales bacterium]
MIDAPNSPSRPARESAASIGALDTLPLFHRLDGRRVVVAGAGVGVAWKVELLLAAGARVEHFLGRGAIARGETRERYAAHARNWRADDLAGAALVIGAGDAGGEALAAAARALSIPVNLIDQPEGSDFLFGTIVNRSPVVIGIGTGGASPMLAQELRSRIERLLPARLSQWAGAARAWRARLKHDVPEFARRRHFWQHFVARTFAERRDPLEDDFARLTGQANEAALPRKVLFVGAGPGSADFLTLGGLRALQQASVVLHDDLVSDEVLELARREAKRIGVGKRAGRPSVPQDEINRLIVAHAKPGEAVVRLKGGDPLVFGRLEEEIEACRAAGIDYEIVPGIGAAQAAAAALGVPLTGRGHARRVQFVTGSGKGGALPDSIEWAAIADRDATTALYMPRRALAEFTARAIAAGLSPATPAAAVAAAGRAEQGLVRTSLAALPEAAAALPADEPVIVLIGTVTREALAEQGLRVA